MSMFLGESRHTIDATGRVALSGSLHTAWSEGVVVTRGFDPCLQAFPRPTWEALAQRINALPVGHVQARNLRRLLFAGAVEVQPDAQGHITIPPHLRDYAGLTEEVLIAGMHSYAELWARERWQSTLEMLGSTATAIADYFATQEP